MNPKLFDLALKCAKYRLGMGSLSIIFNPYECKWVVKIDYSDSTTFIGEHEDIDEATKIVIKKWEEVDYGNNTIDWRKKSTIDWINYEILDSL